MEILNEHPAMRYRPFGRRTNAAVSVLGMGAMRLPLRDGAIDEAAAVDLIEAGFQGGINYIDTAYIYNEGQSERAVDRALSNGWRDKVYLATKLPVWDVRKPGDQEAPFQTQLERLQTRRVDFYLLHALNKRHWKNVLESRSLEWLDQAKRQGRIRFAGFSFHDEYALFEEIVGAYDWDFCQIQYNYAQRDVQAGVRGLKYAAAKGLGVAIMEPLFGGFLTGSKLPPGANRIFLENGLDPVACALRWLWDQPETGVVLSGMSDRHQLAENLRTAGSAAAGSLTARERQVLDRVSDYLRDHVPIACGGCGYCLPHCPAGLKIPDLFEIYNKHLLAQRLHTLQPALYRSLLPEEKASACLACGKCRPHCPQGLDIPDWMAKITEEFEKEAQV